MTACTGEARNSFHITVEIWDRVDLFRFFMAKPHRPIGLDNASRGPGAHALGWIAQPASGFAGADYRLLGLIYLNCLYSSLLMPPLLPSLISVMLRCTTCRAKAINPSECEFPNRVPLRGLPDDGPRAAESMNFAWACSTSFGSTLRSAGIPWNWHCGSGTDLYFDGLKASVLNGAEAVEAEQQRKNPPENAT